MKSAQNFKNILVYRIGHLGDTIIALPTFWEIRKKFPHSKITLLTNSDAKNKNYITAKNVLPEEGLFDSYITYDNSAARFSKMKVFAELFIKLRLRKFDSLYYLSTRNRTDRQIDRDLKFFHLTGIKEIFGMDYLRKNQLNFEEPRPLPKVEPEYQFLFNSIENEKKEILSGLRYDLKLSESEKKYSADWLEKNCGEHFQRKKIIAVAPGSKWNSKLWFEDNYIEVLERLVSEYDVFPVILGGKEDFETGEKILSKLKHGTNAAGQFSIRESAAALENCMCYLGNDTGTMHLAATVQTPCIAIFAAIDYPGRWYPFGADNRIFRETVECEGCHTPQCFNNNKCLKLISVNEVFNACRQIIEREQE